MCSSPFSEREFGAVATQATRVLVVVCKLRCCNPCIITNECMVAFVIWFACLQQNDLGVDHVLRHIYDSRRLRRQEQIVSNHPA